MPGLTAKVFRTYNASFTMSELLQKLKVDDRSIAEKVKLYNDCNREVAILCNHKRTVGASHEAQMEKLGDKVCKSIYDYCVSILLIIYRSRVCDIRNGVPS
jgi:DNA topoisomerase I